MLKTCVTSFSFLLILLSCISELGRDKSNQRIDTLTDREKDTINTLPCNNVFASTLDTNIIDTFEYGDNLIIVKDITDSLYNELFCRYRRMTKSFSNPYLNQQYQVCPKIEADQLKKNSSFASRHHDTLSLKLEKSSLELINTYDREINETYFYIGFLNLMSCHLVYALGDHSLILAIPCATGEKLYLGSRIYSNDSLGQMIFCDFSENELDGGWYNKFSIVESDQNDTFKRVATILFSGDYRNNYKTWGIKDPFWISKNNIVFSYCVGEINSKGSHYDYFFANMTIIKKSAANTRS
jgi:hypothetical protein